MIGEPVPSRRGFTLLELMLAMTIGALCLVLAGGIFYSAGSVDESSERVTRVQGESYLTQTVLRNTFMSLLVVHGNAQDSENPPDLSTLGRPRIILEPDPVSGWQRLEVVLRATPVPGALQGPAARRAFLEEDAESLNFATADGAGGSARCVFEFRRDGDREAVMERLGIENPMVDTPAADPSDPDRGWSLWWRRMTADEVEQLEAGYDPVPDGAGDPDAEARRLASAVRLASGLREAYWKAFHRGVRKDAYQCTTNGDLPAYFELEFRGQTQAYANWLFEIGWAYGEPEDIEIAAGAGAQDEDTGVGGAGGTGGVGTTPNRGGSDNSLRRMNEGRP
ncbi:MAG: type II secretion system protein J [Phycisphaerales bacterium JB040]